MPLATVLIPIRTEERWLTDSEKMMALEVYKQTRGSVVDSKSPLDPERCAIGVVSNERWSRYSQCSNKAKHDVVIEGQSVRVCTIHHPDKVAAREAASRARYDATTRKWARLYSRPTEYRDALREIAAGHNDPRSLAAAVLSKWDDLDSPDRIPKGENAEGG